LVVAERASGDARENCENVVPRELVAGEVEAPTRKAGWIFEDANGNRPDVRDADLRERP